MSDEYLRDEYLQLQKIIEDFDARALTVKAWSVTLSAAGIVTAYIEGNPTILLIAGASAVVFWLIEAMWKNNQYAFYRRVKEIETYFREPAGRVFEPFQIATSWSESWRKNGGSANSIWIMTWPHVALPHLVVAAAATILYFVSPP